MVSLLDVFHALFVGALLYGALYGLLRYGDPGSLQRPVRAEQAVRLVAIGGGAAQVFATQSWGLGLLVLALLSALAYLGQKLVARYTQPAAAPALPTLLLYRGQLLPEALAETGLSEMELRRRLRRQGISEVKHLHAVIRETSGQLGVIQPPAPRPFQPVLHPN